jgi:hypothetical protein
MKNHVLTAEFASAGYLHFGSNDHNVLGNATFCNNNIRINKN